MTDAKKTRCQWQRCYKMVTLLHTNGALDFFLYGAVKVISGKAHECPVLYGLAKQFVETVGKGVVKNLTLDFGSRSLCVPKKTNKLRVCLRILPQ